MNNKQVYQAQTTDHGIARALGEEIRMITDVEETTYNGHGEIIVEYTSDVALTKLFDRIKALYEKGESYETKPFLHFKVLEDDIEPSPNGVFRNLINNKEQTNGISLHGRQERAVYTEQYCGRVCRS